MDQLLAEQLQAGDTIRSQDEIEVTAEEIIAFAQAYDPQPWHLSDTQAQSTPFGSLAASGWHTAAMTMRLVVGMGMTGLIGRSINLSWPTPTRPGDRLHINLRLVDQRESRTKPDLKVITIEYDTVNQVGEIRQHTQATVLVWRPPNKDATT